MEITTSQAQGRIPVTVIRLNGNFDSNSVEDFTRETKTVLDTGARDVVLDLSEVKFMSSVGIRSISSLYDQLHQYSSAEEKKAVLEATRAGIYRAPHLKISGPQKNVLEVIKLVNLDWYLEIFSTEKEALAAF